MISEMSRAVISVIRRDQKHIMRDYEIDIIQVIHKSYIFSEASVYRTHQRLLLHNLKIQFFYRLLYLVN